nr:mitochondrial GTP binding protein 3 [Danio rerio]
MHFISCCLRRSTVSIAVSRSLLVKRLFCSGWPGDDTIYSLSSGQGKCGVAVVRVSGPASALAVRRLTRSLPAPRTASLRSISHPQSKELLDRGLVLWFPGSLPGLRPAEAGEFTRRAFYAGKLDLTEVEGLSDLIHAETEAQRRQALRQMAGDLGRIYQDWTDQLKRCLAHVEAFIDFSEDELIEDGVLNDVDRAVQQLQTDMENHLSDERRGERLRSGVHVVIAGSTNAGKSSLLNLLTQRPAAIVSPTAGTTRDVLEVPLDIGGYPVLLSDTAGLRDTSDSVEQEGVRRARQRVEQADLSLVVVDLTQLPSERRHVPVFLRGHLKNILERSSQQQQHILILNKSDLVSAEQQRSIQTSLQELSDAPSACFLSCHSRDGLEELLTLLHNTLKTLCGDPLIGSPTLTQTRHRTHLQKSIEALQQYHEYRDVDLALAAEGLRLGLLSLGRITGRVSPEEILDVIFRDFCIGK